MVDNSASLFTCTPVNRGPGTLHDGSDIQLFVSWSEPELLFLLLSPSGFNCWFSFAPVFQCIKHWLSESVVVSSPHPRVFLTLFVISLISELSH